MTIAYTLKNASLAMIIHVEMSGGDGGTLCGIRHRGHEGGPGGKRYTPGEGL